MDSVSSLSTFFPAPAEALTTQSLYDCVEPVEVLETHTSWLFMVGAFVYKLKKPLKLPYLDFSTLERRLQNSLIEVRLNRRLSRGVYLGVVPLIRNASDRYALGLGREAFGVENVSAGSDGRVEEWLIRMRRLDAACSLRQLAAAGELTAAQIDRLSAMLANFYRSASAIDISPEAYLATLAGKLRACSIAFAGESSDEFALIASEVLQTLGKFLQCDAKTFRQQVIAGQIIEGHGDLRPEHIFFEDDPQIIDCLEFSKALRCCDPIDELAYLMIECEAEGRSDIGSAVLEAFIDHWHRPAQRYLFEFYAALRACVRTKLAIWRYAELGADKRRWAEKTRQYLTIAEQHAGML